MHLMTSTKQGISAIELGRRLGVSYPTAWYLHKRLRHAMTERVCAVRAGRRAGGRLRPPDGRSRLRLSRRRAHQGPRNGRQNPRDRRLRAAGRRSHGICGDEGRRELQRRAFAAFRDAHIAHAPTSTRTACALSAFADQPNAPTRSQSPQQAPRPGARIGFFWINTAIANLSTAIKATYKAPSPKHLPDYLGAFCWTTNHRKTCEA